jgi:cytochrome b561
MSMADARFDDVAAAAGGDRPVLRDYRLSAKVLHWLTVALVVFMVSSGVIAKQLGEGEWADTLFTLHKTTGALTLLVVLFRIVYRLARWGRELPVQKDKRPLLHWCLYSVVVLVPLAGWAGVSDFGSRGIAFGYSLPPIWPEGAGFSDLLLQWHAYLAFGLLALVALHIGMAMQDYMTRERPD